MAWTPHGQLVSGGDLQVEQRVIRPGGEVVCVLSRGRRKPDDLSRMIGISFDVTERKRAEERFRQIAEHVMDVVWIVDPQNQNARIPQPCPRAGLGGAVRCLPAGREPLGRGRSS